VIGILDPNPTICGRGYWDLVEAGISVDFFPSKLAVAIRNLNTAFIIEHRGKDQVSKRLSDQIQRNKNAVISPYLGIGWGDTLSLQDCPNLREGWPVSQVSLAFLRDTTFAFSRDMKRAYHKYFKENYKKKHFERDNPNFMLEKNPTAFSDSPSLSMHVLQTRYSEVAFNRHMIRHQPGDRDALIKDLVLGSLAPSFPHTLCLHMVVVTSDDKIVTVKRSPKVDCFPNTWSVSVEERLKLEDLSGDPRTTCSRWAFRLLKEELGLVRPAYHVDDLKILSVFLEADYLNVSLCGYAQLQIDSVELGKRLLAGPRTDHEFTEVNFLEFDKTHLIRELLRPSRQYHPTSAYRLLYAMFKRFGTVAVERAWSETVKSCAMWVAPDSLCLRRMR
jgi:hypothetical protein